MRLAAICEAEMAEAMARGWAERDASDLFVTLRGKRVTV